ncbi:hypothetical protein [Arundinibacter roseus]|uniref:Uncharacterized protein n=1 Tax=Arundinibacter roseus TaxID=2070510 RepID=A0A4R4KD33_9BACT|nr:hypothetical protein [Arundinibacter roseus]TDB64381.1 hypothetical protein EZE20_11905 [Arundinibacter roseus]
MGKSVSKSVEVWIPSENIRETEYLYEVTETISADGMPRMEQVHLGTVYQDPNTQHYMAYVARPTPGKHLVAFWNLESAKCALTFELCKGQDDGKLL